MIQHSMVQSWNIDGYISKNKSKCPVLKSDKLIPMDLAKVNQYIIYLSLILSCYQSYILDEAYLFLL